DLIAAPANGRIAWVANAEGVRNLWVADAPDNGPRQLTKYDADDGIDIGWLSITPDGECIVFTRGGDLHTGGDTAPNPSSKPEITEAAVWIVSARDGAPRKIADGNAPEIAPKGDRVAFIAKRQLFVAPVLSRIEGPLSEGKPEAIISA